MDFPLFCLGAHDHPLPGNLQQMGAQIEYRRKAYTADEHFYRLLYPGSYLYLLGILYGNVRRGSFGIIKRSLLFNSLPGKQYLLETTGNKSLSEKNKSDPISDKSEYNNPKIQQSNNDLLNMNKIFIHYMNERKQK